MHKRPNILFFFPDQHRGDWMPFDRETFRKIGLESLPVHMPVIRRMMDQGVTFINAMSPSPLCAPARACLASGRRYEACGVPNNGYDYDPQVPAFYSVLRDAGYSVGGVGKFDLHKKTMDWGLDGWVDLLGQIGFTEAIDNAGKFDAAMSGKEKPADPYMAELHRQGWAEYHADNIMTRRLSTEPTELPEELYCDNWIGKNACDMVRGFDSEKPWFLQINFAGPHNPWDVTRRMWDSWKNVQFPAPNNAPQSDQYDINALRDTYAAMLENIDRICGEVLRVVEERGELDNTILIYAADHGEMLGDFGKFGKSIPDRGSVHIPLVISAPGGQKGKLDESMTELQDLAATILDFCGIQDCFGTDSLSLKPLVEGQAALGRKYQYSALHDQNRNWSLKQDLTGKIVIEDGKLTEVYDLSADVWQNHNLLMEDPARARQICDHFAKLDAQDNG